MMKQTNTTDAIPGVHVLVVDDEPDISKGLALIASSLGADARAVHSAEHALAHLEQHPVDIVVTDIKMSGMSGIDLLMEIARKYPRIHVVFLTGYGTIEMAVDCIHNGAAHFLTKPFDNDDIIRTLCRLGGIVLADRELQHFSGGGDGIIAIDKKMLDVLRMIENVSQTNIPVLIEGESGTGKELVARAIHRRSRWSGGAIVPINCAALPDSLLESELFGYAKGAFTGADRNHEGLFLRAHQGTIFLDEVPSMSAMLQAKLLRVLQDRKIRQLGSAKETAAEFRLVSATNVSLKECVERGEFREDLYYRLNGVLIMLPPLRERPGDIQPLALHFLREACKTYFDTEDAGQSVSTEAMETLRRYRWNGNVRELQHTMQRAAVLSMGKEILPSHLMLDGEHEGAPQYSNARSYEQAKQEVLDAFQRRFLCRVLERTQGNISRAAEECGLTRAAVQKMMRRLDIDKTVFN